MPHITSAYIEVRPDDWIAQLQELASGPLADQIELDSVGMTRIALLGQYEVTRLANLDLSAITGLHRAIQGMQADPKHERSVDTTGYL